MFVGVMSALLALVLLLWLCFYLFVSDADNCRRNLPLNASSPDLLWVILDFFRVGKVATDARLGNMQGKLMKHPDRHMFKMAVVPDTGVNVTQLDYRYMPLGLPCGYGLGSTSAHVGQGDRRQQTSTRNRSIECVDRRLPSEVSCSQVDHHLPEDALFLHDTTNTTQAPNRAVYQARDTGAGNYLANFLSLNSNGDSKRELFYFSGSRRPSMAGCSVECCELNCRDRQTGEHRHHEGMTGECKNRNNKTRTCRREVDMRVVDTELGGKTIGYELYSLDKHSSALNSCGTQAQIEAHTTSAGHRAQVCPQTGAGHRAQVCAQTGAGHRAQVCAQTGAGHRAQVCPQTGAGHRAQVCPQTGAGHRVQVCAQISAGHRAQACAQTDAGHRVQVCAQTSTGHRAQACAHTRQVDETKLVELAVPHNTKVGGNSNGCANSLSDSSRQKKSGADNVEPLKLLETGSYKQDQVDLSNLNSALPEFSFADLSCSETNQSSLHDQNNTGELSNNAVITVDALTALTGSPCPAAGFSGIRHITPPRLGTKRKFKSTGSLEQPSSRTDSTQGKLTDISVHISLEFYTTSHKFDSSLISLRSANSAIVTSSRRTQPNTQFNEVSREYKSAAGQGPEYPHLKQNLSVVLTGPKSDLSSLQVTPDIVTFAPCIGNGTAHLSNAQRAGRTKSSIQGLLPCSTELTPRSPAADKENSRTGQHSVQGGKNNPGALLSTCLQPNLNLSQNSKGSSSLQRRWVMEPDDDNSAVSTGDRLKTRLMQDTRGGHLQLNQISEYPNRHVNFSDNRGQATHYREKIVDLIENKISGTGSGTPYSCVHQPKRSKDSATIGIANSKPTSDDNVGLKRRPIVKKRRHILHKTRAPNLHQDLLFPQEARRPVGFRRGDDRDTRSSSFTPPAGSNQMLEDLLEQKVHADSHQFVCGTGPRAVGGCHRQAAVQACSGGRALYQRARVKGDEASARPAWFTKRRAPEAATPSGHQRRAPEAATTSGHQRRAPEAATPSGHQRPPQNALQYSNEEPAQNVCSVREERCRPGQSVAAIPCRSLKPRERPTGSSKSRIGAESFPWLSSADTICSSQFHDNTPCHYSNEISYSLCASSGSPKGVAMATNKKLPKKPAAHKKRTVEPNPFYEPVERQRYSEDSALTRKSMAVINRCLVRHGWTNRAIDGELYQQHPSRQGRTACAHRENSASWISSGSPSLVYLAQADPATHNSADLSVLSCEASLPSDSRFVIIQCKGANIETCSDSESSMADLYVARVLSSTSSQTQTHKSDNCIHEEYFHNIQRGIRKQQLTQEGRTGRSQKARPYLQNNEAKYCSSPSEVELGGGTSQSSLGDTAGVPGLNTFNSEDALTYEVSTGSSRVRDRMLSTPARSKKLGRRKKELADLIRLQLKQASLKSKGRVRFTHDETCSGARVEQGGRNIRGKRHSPQPTCRMTSLDLIALSDDERHISVYSLDSHVTPSIQGAMDTCVLPSCQGQHHDASKDDRSSCKLRASPTGALCIKPVRTRRKKFRRQRQTRSSNRNNYPRTIVLDGEQVSYMEIIAKPGRFPGLRLSELRGHGLSQLAAPSESGRPNKQSTHNNASSYDEESVAPTSASVTPDRCQVQSPSTESLQSVLSVTSDDYPSTSTDHAHTPCSLLTEKDGDRNWTCTTHTDIPIDISWPQFSALNMLREQYDRAAKLNSPSEPARLPHPNEPARLPHKNEPARLRHPKETARLPQPKETARPPYNNETAWLPHPKETARLPHPKETARLPHPNEPARLLPPYEPAKSKRQNNETSETISDSTGSSPDGPNEARIRPLMEHVGAASKTKSSGLTRLTELRRCNRTRSPAILKDVCQLHFAACHPIRKTAELASTKGKERFICNVQDKTTEKGTQTSTWEEKKEVDTSYGRKGSSNKEGLDVFPCCWQQMRKPESQNKTFSTHLVNRLAESRATGDHGIKQTHSHKTQEHVPQEHVPQEHVPQEHVPREHVLREHVPREHVHREHVPRDGTQAKHLQSVSQLELFSKQDSAPRLKLDTRLGLKGITSSHFRNVPIARNHSEVNSRTEAALAKLRDGMHNSPTLSFLVAKSKRSNDVGTQYKPDETAQPSVCTTVAQANRPKQVAVRRHVPGGDKGTQTQGQSLALHYGKQSSSTTVTSNMSSTASTETSVVGEPSVLLSDSVSTAKSPVNEPRHSTQRTFPFCLMGEHNAELYMPRQSTLASVGMGSKQDHQGLSPLSRLRLTASEPMKKRVRPIGQVAIQRAQVDQTVPSTSFSNYLAQLNALSTCKNYSPHTDTGKVWKNYVPQTDAGKVGKNCDQHTDAKQVWKNYAPQTDVRQVWKNCAPQTDVRQVWKNCAPQTDVRQVWKNYTSPTNIRPTINNNTSLSNALPATKKTTSHTNRFTKTKNYTDHNNFLPTTGNDTAGSKCLPATLHQIPARKPTFQKACRPVNLKQATPTTRANSKIPVAIKQGPGKFRPPRGHKQWMESVSHSSPFGCQSCRVVNSQVHSSYGRAGRRSSSRGSMTAS